MNDDLLAILTAAIGIDPHRCEPELLRELIAKLVPHEYHDQFEQFIKDELMAELWPTRTFGYFDEDGAHDVSEFLFAGHAECHTIGYYAVGMEAVAAMLENRIIGTLHCGRCGGDAMLTAYAHGDQVAVITSPLQLNYIGVKEPQQDDPAHYGQRHRLMWHRPALTAPTVPCDLPGMPIQYAMRLTPEP